MKMKNIININNVEIKNLFKINFDFDVNNIPFIYTEKENLKLKINISQTLVNKTLKENSFKEGKSNSLFVIVENEMGEKIDLIKYNSIEYKKYLTKVKINSSKIEKGTLVKLNNGKELIFLEKLYEIENEWFYQIFGRIIDISILERKRKKEISNYLKDFIYVWAEKIIDKKNIFITKNKEKIYKLEIEKKDFQIIDTLGEFKEFKEIKIGNKITDLIDFNNIKYDKKGEIIRNLMEDNYVYLTKKELKDFKEFIKKYIIEIDKTL